MAADRRALLAVPAAAALLLWPALWNLYPIVFADTGTYLSQAVHRYAGWDRPVFYSLFMLPLHATVTVWPVVAAQALLAAWVLWLVCRVLEPGSPDVDPPAGGCPSCQLSSAPASSDPPCRRRSAPTTFRRENSAVVDGVTGARQEKVQAADRLPFRAGSALPGFSALAFVAGAAALSVLTWLPWIVSELMPDLFTPLLVLVLCLLAWLPERLSRAEQVALVGLAAFMIASQQSSLPLACVLLAALAGIRRVRPLAAPSRFAARRRTAMPERDPPSAARCPPGLIAATDCRAAPPPPRRWPLIVLPPFLAVVATCSVNLAAHRRFAISPFGNVFLLARVIYDGPGMAVLRRDCPVAHWRLCPFLDSFPPASDDFLWSPDSPLARAGGPKAVSADASAIVLAAVLADPAGEARSAMANTLEQLSRFASGDGLDPWPAQVSPWIERDFPAREQMAYAAARQQAGSLAVPRLLAAIHAITSVAGVIACALLLPAALRRHAPCAGFLLAVLLALPVGAAITGGLSAPHDRYQARIMWLPPFVAAVSLASLRRRHP